jgi:hypothetical protein
VPGSRFFAEWRPRWYGFWRGGREVDDALPRFGDLVDRSWAPSDRAELVDYLERAPIVLTGERPTRRCRLCGDFEFDPSAYRFDGEWLWPLDLPHLVARHAVRLPDALVERIRARDYRPPPLPAALGLDALPFP